MVYQKCGRKQAEDEKKCPKCGNDSGIAAIQ